jgi:oligoribonuclease
VLTRSMNEWCIDQHGRSGLTEACISSPHTHDEVEEKARAYIEKWIPEQGAGLLAGSTVHADMRWVLPSTPSLCVGGGALN